MATPIQQSPGTGRSEVVGFGGRIFFTLLGLLRPESKNGQVVLATETDALSRALEEHSGARFTTLPQPIRPMFEGSASRSERILVGSYGTARYEKGSDLMIAAIEKFLAKTDRQDIKFAVQWTQDFEGVEGIKCSIADSLKADARFVHIDHLFAPGEYGHWLQHTSLMLLPYRNDYALRGSRVILEAIVHGIPVVVSRNTTLEEQLKSFGAGVTCDVTNAEHISNALNAAISQLDDLSKVAASREGSSREHFSVSHFRRLLLEQ